MAEEISLADELSKAISEGEPQEAAPAEPSQDSPARDESGKFAAKEQQPAEPQDPQVQQQSQEQQPQQAQEQPQDKTEAKALVTPPATWSASGKAVFASLPEAARREIAKREQDYARGIQQHAEAAKGYERLMREFQPYEAMIRAENGSPEGAIRDLMRTAYVLRTASPQDKGRLVMGIAQQYGADISQFVGQPAQQAEGQQQEILPQMRQMVQELVSPHLQRIQSWEQQQETARQQSLQQQQQEITGQIEAFQNATQEDGITPKHVYFENVRDLMSAYFANGQAQSLEQAYEMACWANPEVRASLIADKQREAEAQRLEEAKRKANQARNASFEVRGQGGVGIAGSTQSSLRDEIAGQLDAALGGARL